MKIRILLTFLLIPITLLGKETMPDSIKIEYFNHWYPFGEDGIYSYKEVFKLKKLNQEFYLQEYEKVIKELKNDSTHIKTSSKSMKVASYKVKKFIHALSENTIPIKVKREAKTKFLRRISLRKLKKVAKENESTWFFEGNDFLDNQTIRKALKSVSMLDTFINKQINYEYHDVIVIDDVNYANINIFRDDNELKYEIQVHQFLAQPFVEIKGNDRIPIYNYNLNYALIDFLPKKSLLNKRLGLKNNEKKYLEWFIENFK